MDSTGAVDGPRLLPIEVDTAQHIALAVARTVELISEQAVWKSKIRAMQIAFDKYGRTEENVLLEREISAEVVKAAMSHASKHGDTQAVVALYKEFISKSPDFLGKVIHLIQGETT